MSLWTYRGLGRAAPGGFVADFFVAPISGPAGGGVNGSPSGTGSITSPWDVQTAFNGPAALVAHVSGYAETNVAFRGGLYIPTASGYDCNVDGVLGPGVDDPRGKIQFRGYGTRWDSGEWAIFDTGDPSITGGALLIGISSEYCWFRDFEILSSDTDRDRPLFGFPYRGGNITTTGGAAGNEDGTKIINVICHDADGGVSIFAGANNGEIYGCISYNVGWIEPDRGHGHTSYIQNDNGSTRFRKTLNWAAMDINNQIYGGASISNPIYDYNICFMAGTLAAANGSHGDAINLLISTATDAVVDNNCHYNDIAVGNFDWLGYFSPGTIIPCQITNNYLANAIPNGCLQTVGVLRTDTNGILDSNLTMSGNLFSGTVKDDDGTLGSPTLISTRFPNNTYLGNNLPTTNFIKVIPVNLYEVGRGHVAVYNWEGLSSVNVDISSFMPNGSQYAVYAGQNPLGAAIQTGTYNGGTISLSTAAQTVATPIGLTAVPASGPEFNAYLIRKTG